MAAAGDSRLSLPSLHPRKSHHRPFLSLCISSSRETHHRHGCGASRSETEIRARRGQHAALQCHSRRAGALEESFPTGPTPPVGDLMSICRLLSSVDGQIVLGVPSSRVGRSVGVVFRASKISRNQQTSSPLGTRSRRSRLPYSRPLLVLFLLLGALHSAAGFLQTCMIDRHAPSCNRVSKRVGTHLASAVCSNARVPLLLEHGVGSVVHAEALLHARWTV